MATQRPRAELLAGHLLTAAMISAILMRPASSPSAISLLGDHGDAMIGGEREHVFVASDALVELVEELADHIVEAQQHVLDFMAAGAEVMAHHVERREADGEKVGRGPLPQLHAVDSGRGQASERGIRVGAFLPRLVEERGGPAVALLQGVRHLAVPLVGRFLAQALVVEFVVGLLRGPVPDQPEVVARWAAVQPHRSSDFSGVVAQAVDELHPPPWNHSTASPRPWPASIAADARLSEA